MSEDPIILPEMPAIQGLFFRSIIGEDDAEALHAVHAGCFTQDEVDPLSSIEYVPSRASLRSKLAQAAAGQQQNQWLVSQVDQQVVGYSVLASWYELDGRWVYRISGWVLPEWRGRGIRTAMLHWGEQTAQKLAAVQHPDQPFEFAASASSTNQAATALLLHEGYFHAFTEVEMDLDKSVPLPVSVLPAGIQVRPVLPEHYPLIAANEGEAYQNEFPGHRFQEDLDIAALAASMSDPEYDQTLWQVAWDGDHVVAEVVPVIAKGRAAIVEVSVHPAWRRKGLARALLVRALQGVRDRGVEVIRLNTVAEFPTRAINLYRSLGFRVLKEFRRYRKSPG